MKREDKIAKAESKAKALQRYAEEDKVMQDLFIECKQYLSPAEWQEYYESMWQQGKWFYAFNCVMDTLSKSNVPITPSLRKLIDACLDVHNVDRGSISELQGLNYDSYWRKHYGYL